MRLTLRTLLAYLDNTLDPQDAESLRNKLSESGFATQLVQRIRGTLTDHTLSAPSPQAVGPVEDANVISEYLDSTLPAEQVAEIERACLESDPQLAEAAACHQILTMVLGKSAEVPAELRKRIYELPDRKIEDIAVAGSFSAVAIPTEEPQLGSLSDGLPTADATSARQGASVRPVGVNDSGVSDAPTRLREAEGADIAQAGDIVIAGSKRRSVENDAKIFAGSIRTSRIAPWLVSLGLAAVLLFALTQIFQPLLNPETASIDRDKVIAPSGGTEPNVEIEVPPEQSPVMVDVDPPAGDAQASEVAADSQTLPAPEPSPSDEPDPAGTGETDRDDSDDAMGDESIPSDASAGETAGSETTAPATTVSDSDAAMADAGRGADAESPTGGDKTANGGAAVPPPPAAMPPVVSEADADGPVPPPPADMEADDPGASEIAKVTGQQTLLAGLVGDQWVRLEKDMIIGPGLKIAAAPTFRGRMTLDDLDVTIVGPAQIQWLVDDQDQVILHVEFGRLLVSAKKADAMLNIRLGDQTLQLSFADIENVAAASIKHFRAPGFDPLDSDSRIPLIGILSVQGTLQVATDAKQDSLQTGQQWVKRGSAAAMVTPVESVPDWIDPPDPNDSSLEASAREGLQELLKGDQPLEIALRETTLFRRSEVGALSGQTLLVLGRGDVYFGGDGILSEPKQRAYWPDHYNALLATVDRSAESATQLRESIERMDSANVEPLFRLLTGYSQNQLVEGGDEELVQLLDSSSMAVRVLALENLHKITGTTLYYRAEQENDVRRAPVIKKWVVRLRKGDIRWQQ